MTSWTSCNTSLGILSYRTSCIIIHKKGEEEEVGAGEYILQAFVDSPLAFVGHRQHPYNLEGGPLVRNQELGYNLVPFEQEELEHKKVVRQHNQEEFVVRKKHQHILVVLLEYNLELGYNWAMLLVQASLWGPEACIIEEDCMALEVVVEGQHKEVQHNLVALVHKEDHKVDSVVALVVVSVVVVVVIGR